MANSSNGPPGLRRSDKPCERCGLHYRLPGERYCSPCRASVLYELRHSGYLERIPQPAADEVDEVVPEIEQAAAGRRVVVVRRPAAR